MYIVVIYVCIYSFMYLSIYLFIYSVVLRLLLSASLLWLWVLLGGRALLSKDFRFKWNIVEHIKTTTNMCERKHCVAEIWTQAKTNRSEQVACLWAWILFIRHYTSEWFQMISSLLSIPVTCGSVKFVVFIRMVGWPAMYSLYVAKALAFSLFFSFFFFTSVSVYTAKTSLCWRVKTNHVSCWT